MFTTFAKMPLTGESKISTVNRNRGPRRRHLLVGALLWLVLAGHGAWAAEDDENSGSHLLDAELALQHDRYREAVAEFRKAAELSDDPEVAQRATRVAYSYGFNEDALFLARRWLQLEPESDEALLYVAQLYLRTGDLRNARRNFQRLLKREDDSEPDERLLALIPFLSQEDPGDAYELMRQLARSYRDSASAHYAVAVMALQAGETGAAIERAKEAIDIDPEWIKPHLVYARSLLLSGDDEGAIDYASRLVGDDPDPDPEARLELAIMLLSVGRDDDALSQVNQVMLEQPARTDALRLMAIINFRLDHLNVARDDFEDLLQTGHYTMDALYYLGRIADRKSEHDLAVRYYSQVTRGSNAVMSQRRASGILAQQGDTEEALQHLQSFGEMHPSHAVDMLQAQAQLLASLDRYPEALEIYDRVIEYRPDTEGVHLGRAELLVRMDRIDEAIEQYRQAVDRWPDSAMSLNALGYTLADRTDQYKEAARLIEKALKIDPESAAIIDSWGWVLYKLGRYEEALAELERAYASLRDPEVAAHIVEVLWKLERLEEAQSVLEEAELLFPDSELLINVRELVFPE